MNINPLHAIDWYKASHFEQYIKGTELVYSNLTPRSSKLSNIETILKKLNLKNGVVFFGLQFFNLKFLIDDWNNNFFNKPLDLVIGKYKRRASLALGREVETSHLEELHKLGYLPLEIRALPEGTFVPIGVPCLSIKNTLPQFFWLTNYIESILSNMIWKSCTSATTARLYRILCEKFAEKTCDNKNHIPFQCHDFSFRGMSGPEDGALSGAGHLTSFVGTDTVLAIDLAEDYYQANAEASPLGMSIPATEHSVMSMGTKENEIDTFERLISDIYPSGMVSAVSDTWDFWNVIGNFLPKLKDKIMSRPGDMSRLVIRPDSGDPVKIVCGNPYNMWWSKDAEPEDELIYKGAIEALWDIFGGTINSKGYKVLDPHIGLIYGDSITPERAFQILDRLEKKGFASSNVVFGVGSFTYTYVTRDTWGFAVKATAGIVNGEYRPIFKDPKTDDGTKRSLRGFFGVYRTDEGHLYVVDNLDHEPKDDLLKTVFKDGEAFLIDFDTIRKNVETEL